MIFGTWYLPIYFCKFETTDTDHYTHDIVYRDQVRIKYIKYIVNVKKMSRTIKSGHHLHIQIVDSVHFSYREFH